MEKPTKDVAETLRSLLGGKEHYFPTLLCANYPQIVEKICLLWNDPKILHRYFTELLTTQREKRAGFAPEVHLEIFKLSEYYSVLHPKPQLGDDFWQGVDTR
jgi:hypothetical protein